MIAHFCDMVKLTKLGIISAIENAWSCVMQSKEIFIKKSFTFPVACAEMFLGCAFREILLLDFFCLFHPVRI